MWSDETNETREEVSQEEPTPSKVETHEPMTEAVPEEEPTPAEGMTYEPVSDNTTGEPGPEGEPGNDALLSEEAKARIAEN